MLLTQTQVSAAISVTIGKSNQCKACEARPSTINAPNPPTVVVCSLALFLSGLFLQQRSVREIQLAYRPHIARQIESFSSSIVQSRYAVATPAPFAENGEQTVIDVDIAEDDTLAAAL